MARRNIVGGKIESSGTLLLITVEVLYNSSYKIPESN